jgi:hypothetical protein
MGDVAQGFTKPIPGENRSRMAARRRSVGRLPALTVALGFGALSSVPLAAPIRADDADGRWIHCGTRSNFHTTGTSHAVSCIVLGQTDRPVEGEGVTFTEEGPGYFTSETSQTTTASGQVSVTVTSTETRTQTITATITDDMTGAEPGEVDECDRAANDPPEARGGMCSDAITIQWELAAASRVTISYKRGVFKGRVSSESDDERCVSDRHMKIKRKRPGRGGHNDKTIARFMTNAAGKWRVEKRPFVPGRFFAKVFGKTITSSTGEPLRCQVARSEAVPAE